MGQIASIGWSAAPGYPYTSVPTGTLSYTFSATQNNGQITQATDGLAGETTVYQYDALKRLTSASNSAWNETFSYDGFGNLTGKTLNGMLQSIPVDPATNRVSGVGYDYNGNMTSSSGPTMTYNEDNRMSSAALSSGGIEYYYYGPDGKRMFRQMVGGFMEFTLWGAYGEQLGTYSGGQGACCNPLLMSVYFGNRLIWQDSPGFADYQPPPGYMGNLPGFVLPDRLGSNAGGGMMYPYGEAPGQVGADQVEFATYTRDSYTGFDNAVNRVYNSYDGRFNTPDPAGGRSAKLHDPGSLNRYAYTRGDPVNRRDKSGLDDGGGDDGCVELSDRTYDCGTVIADDTWGWGDPLGGLFDDPEYAEDCLGEFQECEQIVASAQQVQVAFQAQVNWSTQFRVQAAGYIALNTLLSPSCASLFGVGAIGVPDPYDTLSAILNGTGYASIAYNSMAPTGYGPAAGQYTINNAITQPVGPYSGATFSSATITFNTSPLAPFNFASTSLVNNAATILHELGHVYMYLYGQSSTSILDDSTSGTISAKNQKLVMTECFPGQ